MLAVTVAGNTGIQQCDLTPGPSPTDLTLTLSSAEERELFCFCFVYVCCIYPELSRRVFVVCV